MKQIFTNIKRLIINRFVGLSVFAVILSITAAAPELFTKPQIFLNFVFGLVFNVYMQETDRKETEQRWQQQIDSLQNQINELKKH